MKVTIDININDVCFNTPREELFKLITGIDDKIAEYDFTFRLAKHFTKILLDDNCNELDDFKLEDLIK